MTCPFCNAKPEKIISDSDQEIRCLWDSYPVSPGHALVVTRRHIPSWLEATSQEKLKLVEGIEIVKSAIEKRHNPDGYNIGVNVGAAAGQTVPHLHLHVIPRYKGDVADPLGGVRHVIPHLANYRLRDELGIQETAASFRVKGLYGAAERPLLDVLRHDLSQASSVDIAVAFVLESGLDRIESHLADVAAGGGQIRFLTGDYMSVTEPRALHRLLDLQDGLSIALGSNNAPGAFLCRVFETSPDVGFHPKVYLITHRKHGRLAYIGSSNLTRSALERGIEWNYRLTEAQEQGAVTELQIEFDALYNGLNTVALSEDWIKRYSERYRQQIHLAKPIEIDPKLDSGEPPPTPHEVQQQALRALKDTREVGNRAGLVVLATGLGKTWLSAFDSENFKRVLFVAHREEILRQALATFRRIRPDASFGLYTGREKHFATDVLFASIQTLGRARHLERFEPDAFDYIIVDEFHHAAAATYRRLLDHFEPGFLLGLTATPDRSDGADLLSLCGENLVFRCDLVDGIEKELLSPFHYYGIPDEVDFQNIPWRSGRFDPATLENEVVTKSRAQNSLEEWRKRGGDQTLAFCVSQRHADYMARYFGDSGVKSVAVHAGPTSASRSESLARLEAGSLDIVFAVDMFNEGVDLPHVDTILMLRPSESKILWLQQFGRGLRRAEGKTHVRVIDYIGNHRTFLQAPMVLLPGAADGSGALYLALERLEGEDLELPAGCSVTYELEALNILKALAKPTRLHQATALWYQSFKEQHGVRPTASEAWHAGYDPKSLRTSYGSWHGFVNQQGDMGEIEQAALAKHGEFLSALEVTPMTKSYKMLVLLAMLARNKFPGEITLDDLMRGVGQLVRRSGVLQKELGDVIEDSTEMCKLLEGNPIDAWVGGKGTDGVSYFRYANGVFSSNLGEQESHRSTLADFTRELCEYRLGQYLERLVGESRLAPRIVCNVAHSNGKPILFLPDRSTNPGIPHGWQSILADGSNYKAKFAKIAVNVVHVHDQSENVLPDILRSWFGEEAGQPGRSDRVLFSLTDEEYEMAPITRASGEPVLRKE